MTRLTTEWVEYMLDGMDEYNRDLRNKSGFDLAEMTAHTFGFSKEQMKALQDTIRVGVVPVTQGEGLISCFSESIAAIVESMGFSAEVAAHTDVDGIYDCYRKGFDVIFMADDRRYVAVNTNRHQFSDNNYATALGYIRVLEAMIAKNGGMCSRIRQPILVIGHGIVGK